MRCFLLLALVLSLFGCQSDQPDQAELDAMVARYKAMEGPVVSSFIGVPDGLDPVPTRALPYATVHAQFVDATLGQEDWMTSAKEADALLSRLAREEPDLPYYFLEQSAAINVIGQATLTGLLDDDEYWKDDQLGVLSHHVDIMIKHQNPQAMLIAPALRRLEGYWPEARIQEAARIASHAGETWMNNHEHEQLAWHVHYFDRLTREAVVDLLEIADNQL